jgi:inorganic triphosphatase YgiF
MSETELKFGLPAAAIAAVDAALKRRGAVLLRLENRHFDSADRRLAAAHLALRLRKARGHWEQTLKAPGAHVAERAEETVARPGRRPHGAPVPDPALHRGTAAGARLERALAEGRAAPAPLQLVHVSTVRRRALRVDDARATVEIALDLGELRAGDRTEPLCELEIELQRGDPAALIAYARTSVDVHGMWLSSIAKSTRGERLAALAHGLAPTPLAVKAKPVDLSAARSGRETFRAIVAVCLEQVLANASVLAGGEIDDEAVHQLRVGLRRLRTAARELGPWSEGLAPTWEAPATQVFRELGRYRDRTTIAAQMHGRLVAAGSPAPRTPALRGESVDPVALVRGASFQHALLDLLEFLLAVPSAPAERVLGASDPARASAKHEIATALDRLHAKLRHDARHFAALDAVRRHRARKRLKRMRYLVELVGPLFGRHAPARYLKRLEPAQDELGAYMDLVVAAQFATDRAEHEDARAWFDVGWLGAQLDKAAARAARALRRSAAAKPFWRNA